NADIYRQELTNRTNHIIERYTKTDETLHEVLDYKPDCVSLSTPPKTSGRTTALEVQTAEPTSIKTPLLDWSSARPIDPKATITPPQPKPNEPSAAEISRRVETAKIEWTKHQQIEAAKAAREAAELAELEKQLKELEEQEQKNQIPEREEEVEDTVEKLYKSGDRVKFIDIPKEPTATIDKNDEDFIKKQKLAEITRAKRKYNMKDAGECHGAEELVILKSTAKRKNRSQKEAYMVLLKSNTGDKNDDIVMLDGDSTGVAAYIARRSAILDAIELAGVQEKVQAQKQREGKKATEYDYLHFLMKCCRSEMRQCDARYVIHHPNKDIALEFDQIIEQLRPPVGEISVPREI
ncbi:MAG: hypothetical protein LBU20_00250, partial [Candidatus Nomurabacteria bacterium]|nr:hypothetical protein [Candidatus Nomurabacteria bacterium]